MCLHVEAKTAVLVDSSSRGVADLVIDGEPRDDRRRRRGRAARGSGNPDLRRSRTLDGRHHEHSRGSSPPSRTCCSTTAPTSLRGRLAVPRHGVGPPRRRGGPPPPHRRARRASVPFPVVVINGSADPSSCSRTSTASGPPSSTASSAPRTTFVAGRRSRSSASDRAAAALPDACEQLGASVIVVERDPVRRPRGGVRGHERAAHGTRRGPVRRRAHGHRPSRRRTTRRCRGPGGGDCPRLSVTSPRRSTCPVSSARDRLRQLKDDVEEFTLGTRGRSTCSPGGDAEPRGRERPPDPDHGSGLRAPGALHACPRRR